MPLARMAASSDLQSFSDPTNSTITFLTFLCVFQPAGQTFQLLLKLQLPVADICTEKRPLKRFSDIGQRTLLPFIVNYLYQCMLISAISLTACFQWPFIMKALEFLPSNYHDKDRWVEM